MSASIGHTETEVMIVGAGPVGLTLAIDLGRRGVRCVLVERLTAPARFPKMERCNARTMEHYRRIGIAEEVRRAGYPADGSMDVCVVTRLTDPPLVRLAYPSVEASRALGRAVNDGTLPLEPYQVISQYTLEPLLKRVAEETPNVSVRYGEELVSFVQDEAGVTVETRTNRGETQLVRALFLAGCDGGTSTVRRQLGIQLEGDGGLLDLRQALYRCDGLLDRIPIGPARHYHFADAWGTSIVVQDDRRHFSMHTRAPAESDFRALFVEAVGLPLEPELLWVGCWTQHLLVAARYQQGRVFLAGDAAHLVIPTGGLGMNTGVGDAIDLSWKIAGTLRGWGGRQLLRAYEGERRPIGLRSAAAARYAAEGMRTWRAAYKPDIRDDSPRGAETRSAVARLAEIEQRKCHEMTGIELGHRYADSPLICDEPGGPDPDAKTYRPTTWPGARLPHAWLSDGSALFDRLGDGFTLLRFGPAPPDTAALERALRVAGAPLEVLRLDEPAVRSIYARDLLLVRPDGHVVWRGDAPPSDVDRVVDRVRGRA
jgi:2-polyprenyl-6-methoxyphenol hydroxylase-like FAD-dependent oxidoreductase